MSSTSQPSELTFATAGEAKTVEDRLREQGVSFRTRIVRTRKRGLEYVVTQLGVTDVVG